jgi:putative N6-adenine-specific DNA methylase
VRSFHVIILVSSYSLLGPTIATPQLLNQLSCFAVTAPGLEPLTAAELRALGVHGNVVAGGVEWQGNLESLARANLWLRTASRVLVRIAEFRARTFFELERHARRIPWDRFLTPGGPVVLRVTCRKSRLYHSDAVAQRIAESIDRLVGAPARVASAATDDEPDDAPAPEREQLFVVRLLHDVCTVSADSSGAALHRRGYRQQLAKAPLRETLAAAVLMGADWLGGISLADPMCGSGTIPIEAARLARRIAPGRDRSFACEQWPASDHTVWPLLREKAVADELFAAPVLIVGADRDEGAVAAARANAERAGVAGDVTFAVQPISALSRAEPPGLVASNPPYGVRVGDRDRLRNLYAQIGNVMRRNRPGWTLALLSADRELERHVGLEFDERLRTRNGGIPVHLVVAHVPYA